jgi:hypothetical protein
MSRFNEWLGVKITTAVGSMWAAYVFTALALFGLPPALRGGTLAIVQWIAQTFLQLVLLSIIMVGQNVAAETTEIRDRETHDAVMETIALVREEQQELIALIAKAAPRRRNVESR